MVFKSTAYRMGYGKNMKGRFNGEKYLLYFKTKDDQVVCKEIVRGAGRVDLLKTNIVFNATTVVPLSTGYILSNKEMEVKSIKI